MAVEDEGAAGKKTKRKGCSGKKHSKKEAEGVQQEVSAAKKQKVEDMVSLGRSRNMSARYKGQLACLAALITRKKTAIRTTGNRHKVLRDDNSSVGVYLEWSKEREAYFLYLSCQSTSVVLKFELLAIAGLQVVPETLEIKKPLLMFSESFGYNGKWKETKTLLFEMFSKSDADVNIAEDYLYAFTRISRDICFRIYKINTLPSTDKEGSLEQAFATFVLKPVEIHRSDNVEYFLDMESLLIPQMDNSLTVAESHSGTGRHMQHLGLHNLMLPAPPDLSEWEGYDTNISEYFKRYHAFKQTEVPGTGPELVPNFTDTFPEAYYWHLCLPFKVFARSLIICVGNTFKIKACYANIKEENIFFKGKTVKVLGVSLTNYTLQRAISNLNDVGDLIERHLVNMGLERKDFPRDLDEVLRLLKRNPFKDNSKLEENPVENYDIIKNSICWMAGESRIHVIDDLLQDFLYRMGHFDQLRVGAQFPSFTQWVSMFKQHNFLLRICWMHNLPKNKNTQADLDKWYETKRRELLPYVNHNKAVADQLYSVREYFRSVNNALKHLLQTMFDKDRVELSTDEIDLIGSYQFAATYAQVQKEVPKVLATADPDGRGSYKRFDIYFPPDDQIRFKPTDEK